MRDARSQSGFTLLEIMVALLVLALGLSAVIKTVTTHVKASAYLQDKTLAQWVAVNKLTELRIAEKPLETGKQEGKYKLAGVEWKWKMEVKSLEGNAYFNEVTVIVYLDDEKNPYTTLATYFGKP